MKFFSTFAVEIIKTITPKSWKGNKVMTNVEIFTAGKRLADQLAVITRNGINDDPEWSIKEWDQLRQRVAKFFGWAIANNMKAELVEFVSARTSNQSNDGEWTTMIQDIEENDNVNIY